MHGVLGCEVNLWLLAGLLVLTLGLAAALLSAVRHNGVRTRRTR